ncbi:FAD binding domain-containing protein [Biscogniauxia marginata]|nr:FAD binding domain-containing protein [Biscogniauxia marginata]
MELSFELWCLNLYSYLVSTCTLISCHYLPGDNCWPSENEWTSLNVTVSGRLVKVGPIGAVCHDPTYDRVKCADLKAKWDDVRIYYESTSSLMTAEKRCTIGNYTAYTVDATEVKHVTAALGFARDNDIRFVIRNTGHDFWSRSIGNGGLAVRMTNFKESEILDWDTAFYKGPAFKMGAGMMGFEAQQALEPHGYVMVSGYCPSVGPAGGFVQAGGHSPLSGHFGMGADQTLEYEVVTADGNLIMASITENSDLFYALNGGGAGTWGVVISMTVHMYPNRHMGAAQLYIDPHSMSAETFWDMVDKFYSLLSGFTEQGAYVTYAYGPDHFGLFPFSVYNKTSIKVEQMLKPFTDYLFEKGITPSPLLYNDTATYSEHVANNFAAPQPTKEWPSGGRLKPRDVLTDPARRAELVATIRRIVSAGALTSSTPRRMQEKVDLFAEDLAPRLLTVAPDSGSYSNEADIFMREWRRELYGAHWPALLCAKEKYDPEGVFYSAHTPGADKWRVDRDGRMCRV